jgi:hypothetical protein
MTEDDPDYVPDARFATLEPPSTSSIENAFRLAQAIERRNDPSGAIGRYLAVCDMIESAIQMNPGARIDVKWVLLSLRNIADIYDSRRDWKKSRAYRKCLEQLANYLKSDSRGIDADDDGNPDFDSITTASVAYRRIFDAIHNAAALPDTPPPEAPADLLRRIAEAREKTQQDRIEEMIGRLEEANREREEAIQRSFWKRNLYRAAKHPIVAGALLVLVGLTVLSLMAFRMDSKPQTRSDEPVDMAKLEELARINHEKAEAQKKKHGTRTPKPSRTAVPVKIDESLFDL